MAERKPLVIAADGKREELQAADSIAATDISLTPIVGLTATEVQAAIAELVAADGNFVLKTGDSMTGDLDITSSGFASQFSAIGNVLPGFSFTHTATPASRSTFYVVPQGVSNAMTFRRADPSIVDTMDNLVINPDGVFVGMAPSSTVTYSNLIDTAQNGLILVTREWVESVEASLRSELVLRHSTFVNTDNTTNINALAPGFFPNLVPIFGDNQFTIPQVVVNSDTQVQVNFTGKIRLKFHIHMFLATASARTAMQFRIKKNGVAEGPIASTGYIRATSGHFESSCHMEYVMSVTSGDLIELGTQRESSITGTVNLALRAGEIAGALTGTSYGEIELLDFTP